MVKKAILTQTLIVITLCCAAQKVKIKKNLISINGEKMAIVEDDNAVLYSFYINDLEDNHLLYFKWIYVEYPNETNANYPKTEFNYFEVYDPEDYSVILYEEEAFIKYKLHLIKNLYNAKVLNTSGLNSENLKIYAQKMGKAFSRLRKERN